MNRPMNADSREDAIAELYRQLAQAVSERDEAVKLLREGTDLVSDIQPGVHVVVAHMTWRDRRMDFVGASDAFLASLGGE